MEVNVVLNKNSSKDYSVYIDTLEQLLFDTKVLIVTNTTVAALHLETLKKHISAKELHTIILPDGEILSATTVMPARTQIKQNKNIDKFPSKN